AARALVVAGDAGAAPLLATVVGPFSGAPPLMLGRGAAAVPLRCGNARGGVFLDVLAGSFGSLAARFVGRARLGSLARVGGIAATTGWLARVVVLAAALGSLAARFVGRARLGSLARVGGIAARARGLAPVGGIGGAPGSLGARFVGRARRGAR